MTELRRKLHNGKWEIAKLKNKKSEATSNRVELLKSVNEFNVELDKGLKQEGHILGKWLKIYEGWRWDATSGIKIDAEEFNHLRFTNDIVVMLTTRMKWKVCCKNEKLYVGTLS